MNLPSTPREIEYIIAWRSQPFWPDEQRVLGKLHRALAAAPPIEPVAGADRSQVGRGGDGGHYGGGQARNSEERAIVGKLDAALAEAQG